MLPKLNRSCLNELGFTLVDTALGSLLLAFAVLGGLYVFTILGKSQSRDFNRWKAQLALESVTDTLASISEADLVTLINAECLLTATGVCPGTAIGDPTLFFKSTSGALFAWIAKWEEPPTISDIQLQFKVYGPFPGSSAQVTTPISTPISQYDIEIRSSALLVRGNPNVQEKLQWTKLISHYY